MTFVVQGIAMMLLYALMAARTAAVARKHPARSFQIGKYGCVKAERTAAGWIRRYVPWGLGGGLLVTTFGLFVISRPR